MKIIGTDNLARETIADTFLFTFPDKDVETARKFCNWLNTFSCDEYGGTFYTIVSNDYKLSKGMEDFI